VPKNLDFTGVLAVLSFESRAKVTAKFRSGEGSSEWIKKLKIRCWRQRAGSTPATGTNYFSVILAKNSDFIKNIL